MIYTLDTNVIIHYLRNTLNVRKNFNTAVMRGNNLVIPAIVNYEMRRGFKISSAPKKLAAYDMLANGSNFCKVAQMDARSWIRAEQVYADLYNKKKTAGELDILIAAFCIENNYTLVTNNVKHFKDIDGLVIEDWTV